MAGRKKANEQVNAAWSLVDQNRPGEALAALEQVPSSDAAALVLRGLANYDAGNFLSAEEELSAVLAANPQNLVARYHRGLARFAVGDRAGALADLRPDPAPFVQAAFLKRFLRLFWPLREPDPALSERAPDSATQSDPLAQRARTALASGKGTTSLATRVHDRAGVYLLNGQFGRALVLFDLAHQLAAEDLNILSSLTWALLHAGAVEEARERMEPILADHLARFQGSRGADDLPQPILVSQYAWCLHEQRRHEEALVLLSTIVPQGYYDAYAHILAALCWDGLHEQAKADAAYQVALGPFFLETWELFLRPFYGRALRVLEGAGRRTSSLTSGGA